MAFITFELETLTPIFLAGADQDGIELRPATLKGLLRWWWRAEHADLSLDTLREREGELFGSADLGIKSPLRVSVAAEELKVIPAGTAAPKSGITYEYMRQGRRGTTDVLPYLAYGPVRLLTREEKGRVERTREPAFWDKRQNRPKSGPLFIRPAIGPTTRFEVKLSWRDNVLQDNQQNELVRAMAALVTLGGIGSRARKGFGAVTGRIKDASSPALQRQTDEAWNRAVKEYLHNGEVLESRVPAFPLLKYRIVHIGPPTDSWQHALGTVGIVYKERRPKGESRWIGGDASPRRASSILLTVIRENGTFRGVITLLPCVRDDAGGGEDGMRQFVSEFQQWRIT